MNATDQKIATVAKTIDFVLTIGEGARYKALSRSVYASLDLINRLAMTNKLVGDEYNAFADDERHELCETLAIGLTDVETFIVTSWIFPNAVPARAYIEEVAKTLTAEEVYQVRSLRGIDLDEVLAEVFGEDYRTLVDYSMVDAAIDRFAKLI